MTIKAAARLPIPCVALLMLGASGALSADMRGTLAPAYPAPAMVAPSGDSGFYLRGDLGYGINRAGNIVYAPPNGAGESTLSHSLKSGGVVSVGAGYQVNALLRGDITLEQRGRSDFRYLDRVENTTTPANYYLNDVKGKLGLRVGLANIYMNMGSWNRFTPYVGVGLGVAKTSIRDVFNQGVGPGNNSPFSRGIGDNKDGTSVAWALHAGLSYDLGANWSLEGGYRYLGLNQVKGGNMNCYNGGTGTYVNCNYRTVIKNFGAHDFKFGVRYLFASPGASPIYAQPGYIGPQPGYIAPQAPLSVKG